MDKFTHIDAFHQVVRYVEHTNENPDCPEVHKIRTPVSYRGTVKMHGTNAGVRCSPAGLVPQSRSRVVTLEDDNAGFARWLFEAGAGREDAVRAIEARVRDTAGIAADVALTLFGEFIGPGIQKGTAINALPHRQWVLFAVKPDGEGSGRYVDAIEPLADAFADADVHSVLDVPSYTLEVEFGNRESMLAAAERAQSLTESVEARCPWGARFGVEGLGEGIVWVPTGEHWGNSDLYFKTKGDKHKVTRAKKHSVPVDPEVLAGIEAFVEYAVTDNRLEQGLDVLREQGHPFEMKSMRFFLKWVGQDVKRECASELEASALEWKQVTKAVTSKAKAFFMQRVSAI